MILMYIVCFYPNVLGHPDNYIPANPLVTPAHIVPEWYFLVFYAILRTVPSKLGGVILLLLAIFILIIIHLFLTQLVLMVSTCIFLSLHFLDVVVNCILLAWTGGNPASYPLLN